MYLSLVSTDDDRTLGDYIIRDSESGEPIEISAVEIGPTFDLIRQAADTAFPHSLFAGEYRIEVKAAYTSSMSTEATIKPGIYRFVVHVTDREAGACKDRIEVK